MNQAEKDTLLAIARSAYEKEFNEIQALPVVADVPPDLQIQLDAAKAQIAALQGQLDSTTMLMQSIQSKVDMARVANKDLTAALA